MSRRAWGSILALALSGCELIAPSLGKSLKLPDATDADLAALKQKQDLVELDLEGSRVTDAGLANLMKMKNLLTIGLSGSKVTGAGLENLKTALPNTKIF